MVSQWGQAIHRIKPDKTVSIAASKTGVGAYHDIVKYRGQWLVGTDAGIFRLDMAGNAEKVTGISFANCNFDLGADGNLRYSVPQKNSLHELFYSPLSQTIALTVEKGGKWLLGKDLGGDAESIALAHQLMGLGGLVRYYAADGEKTAALKQKMGAIAAILMARVNSDGSWGRNVGWAGDPFVTAQVGYALDHLNPSPDSPYIRNAVTWLLAKQDASGRWTSSIFRKPENSELAATTAVAVWLPVVLDRLGGIDTDLSVTFPPNVAMSNPDVPPTSATANPDGSSTAIWKLTGVTGTGRSIGYDLTLRDMQPDESRPVSTDARLSFKNTFTGGTFDAPINIPQVKASSFLALGLGTDRQSYLADSGVAVTAQVTNSGAGLSSGAVKLDILAPDGSLLAEAGTLPFSGLAAGASANLTLLWNTGKTLAGAGYSVRGTLTDSGGRAVGTARSLFAITSTDVGSPILSARLSSDKQSYQPADTVRLSGRLLNLSSNALLDNLAVTTTVSNPDGSQRFAATETLAQLAQNGAKEYGYTLPLAMAPAGRYGATLTVKATDGEVLARNSTQFAVASSADSGSGLTGGIVVAPKAVVLGDPATLSFTASNGGNAALDGLPLTARVIDPAAKVVLKEFPFTRSIDTGASGNGSAVWMASGSAGTNLVATLSATVGGKEITLAQDNFTTVKRLTLSELAISPESAGLEAKIEVSTKAANAGAGAASVVPVLEVSDSAKNIVATGAAFDVDGKPLGEVTLLAGGQPQTLRFAWNTGRFAPGSYSLNVRLLEPGSVTDSAPRGTVLDELAGSMSVTPVARVTGGANAWPPLLQAGTGTAAKLSASVQNTGNIPLPAQQWTLNVLDGSTGAVLLTRQAAGAELAVSAGSAGSTGSTVPPVLTLDFGDWADPAIGSFRLEVTAADATLGKLAGTLEVADTAKAVYSVSRVTVPHGSQTVRASVAVTGPTSGSAMALDPLAQPPVSRQGGFDTDLSITFAPNAAMSNPSPAPASVTANADGGSTALWKLATIQSTPITISYDLTLQAMALDETRPVSSDARLIHRNSFTDTQSAAPFTVPQVKAASFLTLKIGPDKPTYQAVDSVTLGQRLTSLPGNSPLSNLTVSTTVSNPDGSQRFAASDTVAQLEPDSFRDLSQTLTLAAAPAGQYAVSAQAVAVDGTVLARAASQFTVASSADTGSGLTGSLAAAPKTVTAGDSVTFSVNASNGGNATLTNLPLTLRIHDPAQNLVKEFSYSATIAAGADYSSASSWPGVAVAGAETAYSATLSASFGTSTLTLGQDSFKVLPIAVEPPAKVSLDIRQSVAHGSRVLVLVGCKDGEDDSDPTPGDATPAPCVAARTATIGRALAAAGVVHAITADAADFQRGLRSGLYNTYWLSGRQNKLTGDLPAEIREAVFGGDGLIVDGTHDQRNKMLDAVNGIVWRGKLGETDLPVDLSANLFGAQRLPSVGRALKLELGGGTQQGAFNGSRPNSGGPAVVSAKYGAGKTLAFGFDFVDSLNANASGSTGGSGGSGSGGDSGNPGWQQVLATGLAHVLPTQAVALTPGAPVPVKTSILNTGAATDITVKTQLPPGATAGQTTGSVDAARNTVSWAFRLAEAQSRDLFLTVRAPTTSSDSQVQTTVSTVGKGGVVTQYGSPLVLTLSVTATAAKSGADALAAMQAYQFAKVPDRKTRDAAVAALQTALAAMQRGGAAGYESALGHLLLALDQLSGLAGLVDTRAAHEAIGRVLREAQWRWVQVAP